MTPVGHHIMEVPANRRDTHHYWGGRTRGYASAGLSGILMHIAGHETRLAADPYQHTDPSPHRFAFLQGEPDGGIGGKATDIAYHATLRIALCVKEAESWLRNTILEGNKKCKKHPFSWLLSQPLALQAVSTMTLNVLLLAQARVLSQPKFWAQTVQVRCLLVPQQACSVTTQVFAGNINSRANPARLKSINRRWGMTLAAIFCLGDEN